MPINLHAATRRELILASGARFAWAHMPKIALAEGRTRHALEEYQRILTSVPDFVDAHRNAAMAHLGYDGVSDSDLRGRAG